ncbi:hypothetical protein GCM10018791_02270 [Streptomyces zaomyceticus]|nr:hypothetical protein GCM10018791_02270 [Streptomyces zaomyceticus]
MAPGYRRARAGRTDVPRSGAAESRALSRRSELRRGGRDKWGRGERDRDKRVGPNTKKRATLSG